MLIRSTMLNDKLFSAVHLILAGISFVAYVIIKSMRNEEILPPSNSAYLEEYLEENERQ